MNYVKPEEISTMIILSKERARENEVSPLIKRPLLRVTMNKLEQIVQVNQDLIQVFKSSIDEIRTLLKNEYMFVLTSTQLILLEYLVDNRQKIEFLEKGMSFSDISIGTNAISLAKQVKKPVYLTPDYHYSNVFKKWYCFAIPIIVSGKVIGFLDGSTINKELKDEIIIITKLLAYIILDKIKSFSISSEKNEINLTKKQSIILEYIATGLTEQAAAFEMGISPDTIKYHKKKVFKLLQVDCTPKAIIKAVKMGLLNVEEIDV